MHIERIREAIAQYDDGEAGPHQVSELAAAARAYVRLADTGRQVDWCETHESRVRVGPGGRPGDERCERAELHLAFQPSVGVRTCLPVPMFLTPIGDQP